MLEVSGWISIHLCCARIPSVVRFIIVDLERRARKRSDFSVPLLFGIGTLLTDLIQLLRSGLSSRAMRMAENLFLRKQLALYEERGLRPRPAPAATQLTMIVGAILAAGPLIVVPIKKELGSP